PSSFEVVAFSHPAPMGGRGESGPHVLAATTSFSPLFSALSRLSRVLGSGVAHVPLGQSASWKHGSPGLVELLEHRGRQTVNGGSFPLERWFSHLEIAFKRFLTRLPTCRPRVFVQFAASAPANVGTTSTAASATSVERRNIGFLPLDDVRRR